MAHTAAQLIDQHGGSAAFAAAIGVDAVRVRMMKHRNKLPRSVWPEIMGAFPDLTLERLIEAEAAGAFEHARAD